MLKIYYEKDADISILKGKKIAVIGYGSQGHAQAQNLRESGVEVIVSTREGTANYQMAVKHGFKPVSVEAAAKEGGFEVIFKNTAWDGIFAGIEAGKYDAIISSVTINDERKKTMDFSDPYINAGQILVVSKKDKTTKKLADLKGKKAGISAFGSSSDLLVRLALKKYGLEPGKDVAILPMGGQPEGLAALQNGSIQIAGLTFPLYLSAAKADLETLARELAMQSVAMSPKYLKREDVAAELVEKEREIYRAKMEKDEADAQAKAAEQGKPYKAKPAEAIAKMLEGRVNKFFQESCLIEQASIRDSKLTVIQAVKNLGAKLGGNVAVTRFNCFLVGIE